MAAAAYGAPVGVRSDHPLDFYVPDGAALRRAVHLSALLAIMTVAPRLFGFLRFR
jgi:hypothetical protein